MKSKWLSTTACAFVKKFCLASPWFSLSLYPGNTIHHMLTERNIKDKSQQVNQIASLFNYLFISDGIGRLFFARMKSPVFKMAFQSDSNLLLPNEIPTSQIIIPKCQ